MYLNNVPYKQNGFMFSIPTIKLHHQVLYEKNGKKRRFTALVWTLEPVIQTKLWKDKNVLKDF